MHLHYKELKLRFLWQSCKPLNHQRHYNPNRNLFAAFRSASCWTSTTTTTSGTSCRPPRSSSPSWSFSPSTTTWSTSRGTKSRSSKYYWTPVFKQLCVCSTQTCIVLITPLGSREETHKIGRDKPKMLHSSRLIMVNLYFHCWQSLDQDFSGFLRSNFMSLIQRAL